MGKQNQRRQNSRSHSKHMQNSQRNFYGTNKKNNNKQDQSKNGRPPKDHRIKKQDKDYRKGGDKNDRRGDKNDRRGDKNDRNGGRVDRKGGDRNDKKNDRVDRNGDFKVKNGTKPKKDKNDVIDPNNPLKSLKKLAGNSAFKIMPEGLMNDQESNDKFAALEGSQDEQQYQQQGEEQIDEEDLQDQEEDQQQQGQQQEYQGQDYQGEVLEDQDERDGEVDQDSDERDGEVDQEQIEEQPKVQQSQEQQEPELKLEQSQQQDNKNPDISVINLKIQQTLSVLMNVARLGQGKTRKHFIDKLKKYVHQYYGYNFQLIDHFLCFLNPMEMIQFFEANETQRPLTIRTNTLKTRRKDLAQSLIQRGVNLDPLAQWSKVGIKIYETKVPIGATPEYLAGYYMLQSASSLLPVLALDPQMNEKILDMAAAPGGKTSYIAQIMKNTGSVFANDLKKERLKALQFNLYRLGITNTVVTCRDGRKYSKIFPNAFDRVLLDSPCTGLGIISKDMSIKANRMLIDIYKNSHVQKQLLLSAIDCTKVGGIIVYSTCSVSPLQNQQVVNFALKKRYVKIVDMDELVEVGQPGLTKFVEKRYHVDLRKTKRIYPHVHNMDGFYFAKLVKVALGKKIDEKSKVKEEEHEEEGSEIIEQQAQQ